MTKPWETTADLVAAAEVGGHDVSAALLARWHRAGLLPAPSQSSLGRGRGSESRYPAGTADRLLVLLDLRGRRRSLDELAWGMWWAGSAIPTSRARPYLSQVLQKAESDLARLVDHKGSLTSTAEEALQEAHRARLPPGPLAWVRRRIGPCRFDEVMEGIIWVAAGEGDKVTSEMAELIERSFGLDRARRGPGPTGAGWLEGSPVENLLGASKLIHPRRLAAVVANSSDQDLEKARGEVQLVVAVLGALGQLVKAMGDRWAYGFGPVGAMLDSFAGAPTGQATLVALWRSLEEVGWRAAMDTLLLALSEVDLPPSASAFLEALRREIPEASSALLRAVGTLADPDRQKEAKGEIARLRERHGPEIDDVAARLGLRRADSASDRGSGG